MIENYLYLFTAIIFTTVGHISYKLYFTKQNLLYMIYTILCFMIVPYLSYKALIELTLDYVYMTTSINIILILISSRIFLDEKIYLNQIIGSLFIVTGIILYNF